MMKITVIIPSYRPQSCIWECLDSLCRQTLDKSLFEVIVVLNGCGNPWLTDIKRYIEQKTDGMNIRILHTDEPGVSNARNIGLDNARGEYITFVDDDDWFSPSALQDMYALAARRTVVCCDVQCVDPVTREVSSDYLHSSYVRNNRSHVTLWSARSFFSTVCCKLIPVEIIAATRFDPRFAVGEDSLFMAQLAHGVQSICFAPPSAVYFRRLSHDSASRKRRPFSWRIRQFVRLNLAFLGAWARHPFIDPRFPLSRIATTYINMLNFSPVS